MKDLVNINGTLQPADRPWVTLDNRGYRFGDGLFETMRVVQGEPCFVDAHWARLVSSADMLSIKIPPGLDRSSFEGYLRGLVEGTGHRSARCRLTLYRSGGGYYRPETDLGAFTIDIAPLADPTFTLNDQGLVVDIWPDMRKPINVLSRLKTLNCQYYVMGAIWARQRGLDDCLLQNERGNIIESSSGNLFIVSNGVLYTPALSDGCLGGVMRAQVINLALAHGIKVYECALNPQNLLAADEVFFTNAVRGLQWVGAYRTKRYTHRMSARLMDLLTDRVARPATG
jgi:branched-chain amino acid aminotransferase